jgi:two-component system LytT family response regulator
MTIASIIVDHEPTISAYLKKCLVSKFPEILICGEATSYKEACELIRSHNPALVFSDLNIFDKRALPEPAENANDYEIVYTSHRSEDAISAIRQDACGFILKPLNVTDIVASVGSAIQKFSQRSFYRTSAIAPSPDAALLPHTKLFGIPTMEGLNFLYVHEIVRCEGLQKCTRVVSTRKANMISSYNIGEFRKLLEAYGFFACHKSHLINLMHVKKFTREGFIYLIDNVAIPLARRKRLEFLDQLRHL